jgi:hypothetical protein
VYDLSPTETRRLKALTRGVPFDADPFPDVPNEPDLRTAAIMDVLLAVLHHEQLLMESPDR